MAIFRYQHGDTPLEGYTIQHGLGRGGFGEVYYAVSDAGREVALKSVQNYEDIELRGIKHCMNLKHPQLVSIFDIRHNEQGLPFVIMEYVDGPSLREIMDSHPDGLGTAKAAFFFQELAKGLGYLHDCGVVHRDLKPHNVFYEQGVVKVGDYSLSKAISTSHRGGHTMTVGTVHYMAPEISLGRYDHTVDIYALGVMLYEMLTGHPPFLGESMGEVLMKHVNSELDVSHLPEPFAQVVSKSLRKDPAERYQSAQAMVDDLFGSGDLRDSVASLGPESLTMVAEQANRARQSSPPPPPHEPQATIPRSGAQRSQTPPAAASSRKSARPFPNRVKITLMLICTFAAMAFAVEVDNPIPIIVMVAIWIAAIRKWTAKKKVQPSPVEKPSHAAAPEEPIFYAKIDRGNEPPRHAHVRSVHSEKPFKSEPANEFFPDTDASPYSRLISLLIGLPMFFGVPLAGLQRLYVGKVRSGLLWLFTFGLFGVGQLYDMVMIALGHFRDVDGRRVLYFTQERFNQLKKPVNQYSAVVKQQWTESRIGFRLGNLLLNLLGGILLIAALLLGTSLAIDVPGAFADGVFGYEVQADMVRNTQVRDWNELASVFLAVATTICGTLAAVCLIFARRDSTWPHLSRVPVASIGFVLSVLSLGSITEFGEMWPRVASLVNDRMIGAAIRSLDGLVPGLAFASITFVAAMFFLAWPAKRVEKLEANGTTAQTSKRREHAGVPH